jgi:hypothetical protein
MRKTQRHRIATERLRYYAGAWVGNDLLRALNLGAWGDNRAYGHMKRRWRRQAFFKWPIAQDCR